MAVFRDPDIEEFDTVNADDRATKAQVLGFCLRAYKGNVIDGRDLPEGRASRFVAPKDDIAPLALVTYEKLKNMSPGEGDEYALSLTPRGLALVNHILNIPFPEQRWVIPE